MPKMTRRNQLISGSLTWAEIYAAVERYAQRAPKAWLGDCAVRVMQVTLSLSDHIITVLWAMFWYPNRMPFGFE